MISYFLPLLLIVPSPITSHWNPLISECPGEGKNELKWIKNLKIKTCNQGPRYGDFKCIHDRTHRVCAKLISDVDTCQEAKWSGKIISSLDKNEILIHMNIGKG